MTLKEELADVEEEIFVLNENEELRRSLRSTQRRLAQAKLATEELHTLIYRAAHDAARERGAVKIPKLPKRDRRRGKEEVALIHTTDWQVGKKTESYSSEIARERLVVQFTAKIERLTELHSEARPVRVAHYLLGGDMVEGIQIFAGQPWAIDSTLFEQLFLAAEILEHMLLHALTIFEQVHAWEEKGNHGRLFAKGEAPEKDNIDLAMYRIVRDRFRHEPRIVWHPLDAEPPLTWNHVTIGNYKALLFHGDEIRGGGAAATILRKLTKWRAGVAPVFKDSYGGHFHTSQTLGLPDGGRIFMSGSPESDNDFATEVLGETGDPSQRVHFIDPEKGRVTAEYVVYLQ